MAAKTQTKAQRIYEDTERVISIYVYGGTFFDSLSHLKYGEDEVVCQRTINALRKIWDDKARILTKEARLCERHPEWVSEIFASKVEVLRRMYLTIQAEQRCIDALKSI